jgi:hypothetical protein
MDAAKKIILLLALVVACALPASALTPSAPENRVWEKITGTLETHQEAAPQVPQSHQEEAGATAETASECFLAAEETAPQLALPAPTGGNPWIGEIQSSVTSEETTMYRVWGGDSGQLGGWLSPVNPGTASAARSGLALPAENTTEFISEVTVPAGTRIQTGTAGPLFGQPGGASQVLLLDRIPAANFGPGVPLPP